MDKIKEVIVFANGDSSKLSTWSNVPFFFTETLLTKGIKVDRVNLGSGSIFKKIYNRILVPLLKIINKETTYEYVRSGMYHHETRRKIKKAINQYPDADAHIFLTFRFSSAGLTNKPIIQFCDWTYDHYFKYRLNRTPDFLEQRSIRREDSQIVGTDLIFPLFPSVSDYMKSRYINKEIYYLGNVINSLYEASESDIDNKLHSYNLLFVGSIKYLDGAKTLIEAFTKLKPHYPAIVLNIIGISNTELQDLPNDVFCHGYLDKGITAEMELYYKLFKESRIFINTTPKWGAFSACIEAMYFHTPVIVTPYDEFVKTFGKEINFGSYCEQNDPTLIAEHIRKIFEDENYKTLCYNAHESVHEFTWSVYIDKIIRKIEEKKRIGKAPL
ncbi:MAG: glycosyltransferase family 4 protein [Bacteroidota bacterium]